MTTLFLLTAWALAEEPTIEELLNATDDMARGASSEATLSMHVKTDRYERTVKMTAWSEGTEKTLIRIEEPAKEKGVATLKVGQNIWNYLPKVDRTVKVPAGMMGGSWMGSHFTNDDLVKENRLADEFTYEISKRPEDNEGRYEISLVPKEDAAVVWGKVLVQVTPEKIPVDIRYFDEDDELVRTMTFENVQEIDGRQVAMNMRIIPADKPGEFTAISYEAIDFDVEIPESRFTLQALRK